MSELGLPCSCGFEATNPLREGASVMRILLNLNCAPIRMEPDSAATA